MINIAKFNISANKKCKYKFCDNVRANKNYC